MAAHDVVKGSRRDFLRAAGYGAVLLAALPLVTRAASAPLKIATLGAGRIGSTLGGLWVKAGHPVMFSSRHPEELKNLAKGLGPLAHAGTVREAVAFGDVVLLAVPYRALPQIGKDFARALAAKVLVFDACNPFPGRDLASAELLPGARLVRAFNAISYARLPDIAASQGERTGMPMAGDDAKAIAVASSLLREIGFEAVFIGPLAMGRHLIPGTPLAGEHTPQEIRRIAATLE